MDRLAATAALLEALAMDGADAERLALEIAGVAHSWREETEAEIARLRRALAAASIRHQSERDRALWQGMAAESARQSGIAQVLAGAAHGVVRAQRAR